MPPQKSPSTSSAFNKSSLARGEKDAPTARAQSIGVISNVVLMNRTGYVSEDYTLYDVYGSYAFNENTTLRFAVSNLTDVAYVPALGTTSYPGPGRTATVSLGFKF